MRDPYLFEGIDVLRNLGDIRNSEELKSAEADITKHTMTMVYAQSFQKFNTDTLCEIHRIIFGNLYDWAGEFRTIHLVKREETLGGDTVRYSYPNQIKKELTEASKEILKLDKNEQKDTLLFKLIRIAAKIWQAHPFREGNTRTVISFIVLLAEYLGITLNYSLFEQNAAYVRNSLVWASQGIYSKYEYLEKIFFDAAGLSNLTYSVNSNEKNDYTHIEGYYVADYVEQPHNIIDNNE